MIVDYDVPSLHEDAFSHQEWIDETCDFSVTWINLHYYISLPWWKRLIAKKVYNVPGHLLHTKILDSVTGQMKAGQVTALLGPSGSGKTILFDCLMSRRVAGLSGRIRYESNKAMGHLKVAYVQQSQSFSSQLTVRELVNYSSRLQNSSTSKFHEPHDKITSNILKLLGLEVCADNLASRCSGGQMKRIAIAVELVSAPSILILDEPTSGLDSTATSSLIHLLKTIATGEMYGSQVAIIVSIHQPSWETLNIFDTVIMMSKLHGQVIYDGPPADVPYFLSLNNITYEDIENPADLLMELACGSHETEGIERAVSLTRSRSRRLYANRMDVEGESLIEKIAKTRNPLISSTLTLASRCLLISVRDYYLLALRVLSSVGALPILYVLFENSGGQEFADGCPINLPSLNETKGNISVSFIAETAETIDYANSRVFRNASNAIVVQMFCYFMSVVGDLFSVSRDFSMIRSEVLHYWYPLESFVLASIFTEFLLTLVFSVTLLTLPWYFMSEQKLEFWRIVVFCLTSGLVSLVTMALGGSIASMFLGYSFATCLYVAFLLSLPQILLAGHLIASRDLPLVLFNMYYFLPLSVASQSSVITLYGFERCHNLHMIERYIQLVRQFVDNIRDTSIGIWSLTNRTDVTGANDVLDHEYEGMIEGIILRYKYAFYNAKGDPGSLVMAAYDYDDADLGKNLFWLTYQLCTYRFIYYILYRLKVYARQ